MALSWFSAGGGAGTWNILRILFGIDDPPAVLCERRPWGVESAENSFRNRRWRRWRVAWRVLRILFVINDPLVGTRRRWFVARPRNGFPDDPLVVLGSRRRWRRRIFVIDDSLVDLGGWRPWRGASSKFLWEWMTLSWFSAGGGAGAWSILQILFGIDDPHFYFTQNRRKTLAKKRLTPKNNQFTATGLAFSFGRFLPTPPTAPLTYCPYSEFRAERALSQRVTEMRA